MTAEKPKNLLSPSALSLPGQVLAGDEDSPKTTAAPPAHPAANRLFTARPTAGRTRWQRWARMLLRVVSYTALVLIGALMLAPFWWAAATSLVPAERAFSLPPPWLPTEVQWENYTRVFELVPFARQVANSLEVVTITVVGSLLVSLLAAYAFARLRFPGREALFSTFLVALMVPTQVTLIPTFVMMRYAGLLDHKPSLWLPALIQVFSIFMLRQHFMSLPKDIEEAARLDGAGDLRILFRIYLPMSAPIVSALAIFIATTYWNDFITPNTFLTSPEQLTIPVGLASLQNQFGSSPTTVIFAGITMVVIPLLVVFLFAQRKLTEGVALSGVSR